MRSILLRAVMFSSLLAVSPLSALAQDATGTRQGKQTGAVHCMLDDGHGRLRSCSQGYKKSNPAWRTSDNCYTDDGYGRYRSCSAGGVGYKRKHPKI